MDTLKKGLTSFDLKIIGIVLMVLDHIHQMFLPMGAPIWLNMLGRLVLPIFLFLLAEGYHYTHDVKRYMLRLLLASWVMNILSNLIGSNFQVKDVVITNNIFITMFLALFYMWMIDTTIDGFKKKQTKKIFLGILGMLVPVLTSAFAIVLITAGSLTIGSYFMLFIPGILSAEGGLTMLILPIVFHLLRTKGKNVQLIGLVAVSLLSIFIDGGIQWMMVFAAIPLYFYNGQQGRRSKWFFYIFYPAHIYLLYMLAFFLQK